MARDRVGRREMVRELQRKGIASPRVLEAMGSVPRGAFVDEALGGRAHCGSALPIGDGQTISQPWIVARMTELVESDGRGRVLEIGTGSGYHAAVLSKVFEQVYTVERILAMSRKARERIRRLELENVHFKVFDGGYGWSEFAPYQAIVVTAAAPDVPAPLLEQLRPGGKLVLPVAGPGGPEDQTLVRITRTPDGHVREEHGRCKFVPLVGRFGAEGRGT